MKNRDKVCRRLAACILWSIALTFSGYSWGEEPSTSSLKVMSFNIRYGTARDRENHWNNRKEFLVETIKVFNPDVLGTQETLAFQRDYLAEHLAGYTVIAAGRDDGKEKGEMMAVYFRTNRFELLDSGHFWLSETPDRTGSKGWGSKSPRMVTWLKLRDRLAAAGSAFFFFNTHFDYRSLQTKIESARLLRKRIVVRAGNTPVVVTGDFNSPEGSAPYDALFNPNPEKSRMLFDTYRKAHPERGEQEGTFSGFGQRVNQSRIDWIACSHHWRVLSADIDRTNRHERTPSDHYPVTAILQLNLARTPE